MKPGRTSGRGRLAFVKLRLVVEKVPSDADQLAAGGSPYEFLLQKHVRRVGRVEASGQVSCSDVRSLLEIILL
ncbi:MAG: hypothetical protein M3R68_08040 [Acidobacteriota bacterium]|nr:hypothetical protein [Acidobacteriota bacterium]